MRLHQEQRTGKLIRSVNEYHEYEVFVVFGEINTISDAQIKSAE